MGYLEFKKQAQTDYDAIDKVLANTPMRTEKLFRNMARIRKPEDQFVYATSVLPLAIGHQQFINGGRLKGKAILKNPQIQKGLAAGAGHYALESLYPRQLVKSIASYWPRKDAAQ